MSASAVGELLAALVVIITLTRFFGALAKRFGQPAVVGEILVGVVLGPTFFGLGLANHLFPLAGVRPALSGIGPQTGAHLIVRANPSCTQRSRPSSLWPM
jgi:predicted Kef-type K+ transport protein